MAILDPFALKRTSDMQIQALLTGQQSSVARCSKGKKKRNFNLALFTGVILFLPRDLREHSSSTITIELEVARRAITANTKVHSHRRRIDDMILTFDEIDESVYRSERTIRIEIRERADAKRTQCVSCFSVSSFPSSRDRFSRYTANRSGM